MIEGYEVYALDTTPNERPVAETLEERVSLKSEKNEPVRYGHKYSWLSRLVSRGTSWTAPVDVRRVAANTTDSQTGALQVQELDQRHKKPKVIVADSLYGNHRFLAVFLKLKHAFALVRLRSNMVFYGPPKPYQKGQRGRPAKHGIKFRLSEPPRPADQQDTFQLREQSVRLQAWEGLHLKKLPDPVGMVLKVEFLRPDGTPRYIRPLWLFWTGPTTISLKALCLMYLWRFAIEHTFRFLKQHLGLNTSQSTDTICTDHWMWLCGLAYWQLLLMRDTVNDALPAWYPAKTISGSRIFTPGQVQRDALRFLMALGTPASSPRHAGKGKGRPTGYHPPARTRFPIVKKMKIPPNRASASP